VPIPGTTSLSHLDENLGAIDLRFTALEMQAFNADLSRIVVHGERLAQGLLEMSDREAAPPAGR
jgi:diketogulonate reductase-like aldo/keto reductase